MTALSKNSKSEKHLGSSDKFIRMSELPDKVGICRSQIYKLIQRDDFPKQVKIGDRISVWRQSEVDEWMDEKVHLARLHD